MTDKYDIFYEREGKRWFDSLPVGNGRLGAMVYGGICETIELNETTCYSGEMEEGNNPKALEYFPKVKEEMLQRNYAKAEEYAKNMTGTFDNYGTNLPLGNFSLDFYHNADEVSDYTTGLCFEKAYVRTKYCYQDVNYTRTTFCTNVDDVIVIHLQADQLKKIAFTAKFNSGNPYVIRAEENRLILEGKAFEQKHTKKECGVSYCEMAHFVLDGGEIKYGDEKIVVQDANEVVIYIAIHSDFDHTDPVQKCEQVLKKALEKNFQNIKEKHEEDFARLYKRVDFHLDGNDYSNLPMDVRMKKIQDGEGEDYNLMTTMFQYARYLLISSSRENSPLPTHLQGVWNDNEACRIGWTCDMHLDINTQVNYWPSQVCNLSECAKPLFDWIYNILLPSGKHTAKMTYGCNGFVAHTVSNPWGYTAPGCDVYWGFYVTGGAWITTHMWEHYQYTKDYDFLKNMCYPMLKENCLFFIDYLVEDPKTGYYVTPISHSPENGFYVPEGEASLAVMPTCDIVVLIELFEAFIDAASILNLDQEMAEKLATIKAKFPPYQIGEDGRLQEWMDEFVEKDRNHRHVMHLMGLHPFHSITAEDTLLAKACEKSIESRLTPYEKWEDTGFGRSMIMCYYARLLKGNEAYFHAKELLACITEMNLLVFSPPTAGAHCNVFELDGNCGYAKGIAEMLLQSHKEVIHLLPAIPQEWTSGYVTGLKAVNGIMVDIYMVDHGLEKAIIEGTPHQIVAIRYKDKMYERTLNEEGKLIFKVN